MSDEDKPCIPEQRPISVGFNHFEDVLIYQPSADGSDIMCICVRPENVQALVKALQDAVA